MWRRQPTLHNQTNTHHTHSSSLLQLLSSLIPLSHLSTISPFHSTNSFTLVYFTNRGQLILRVHITNIHSTHSSFIPVAGDQYSYSSNLFHSIKHLTYLFTSIPSLSSNEHTHPFLTIQPFYSINHTLFYHYSIHLISLIYTLWSMNWWVVEWIRLWCCERELIWMVCDWSTWTNRMDWFQVCCYECLEWWLNWDSFYSQYG